MLAGDIDGLPDFVAPELLPQFEGDARFRIAIGSSEGETILAINNARPPFNDVRVRRALAHAVDRRAIIDGAMFGYGAPIGSHFAPHHPAYVDLTSRYPYDPDRARALLAEAGVTGLRPTLKLPPPPYARRSGEIVAAQLRAVGIEPHLENVEWAQWLEQVFTSKDFDLTLVSHTEPMDIEIYARDDYYFNYRSPALKRIMAALDAATEEPARIALLQQAQRLIAEDCVNVFLFQFPKIGVWRSGVEGVSVNAPIQANDFSATHWRRA
ncbi:MAG: ABC transporter substrate-binding protein [Terricaulis sp.]